MLLSDESRAYARAQMLIQETGYLAGTDIAATFQEAAGKGGDSVAVGVDEVGEDGREFHFIGEGGDVRVGVGKESGEGVLVVGVYARDIGVGDDNVREVAQGLDAVREADRKEGEREVGRGEERFSGEGRAAVPDSPLVWKGERS